jgi:molybdopterin molybdotransferase
MKSLDQIAAELQGYDPQALSVEAVNEFLARMVTPLALTSATSSPAQTETVPIFEALGRTLAHDLVSPLSVPPHDNSAMDGYAFSGDELARASLDSATKGSVSLEVLGTALAGKAWTGTVGPGQCVKIMTGAVVPAGLDTVIPQELTQTEPSERSETGNDRKRPCVRFSPSGLRRGDNRRLAGEDLMQGQAALRAGDALTSAALGLVASLGLGTVTVFRRLRVAYFSTGNEILSLGEAPREGAVYDSNRYTVFGMLTRLGCEVIDMGVVADEPVQLEAAFVRAAALADAIITSGGVSVGEADYTKAMMKKLGDVAFWRIAMRPGRPMAVGLISTNENIPIGNNCITVSSQNNEQNSLKNGTGHAPVSGLENGLENGQASRSAVLFGLPGNPVAVMVTFLAFVRPALLRMMGRNRGQIRGQIGAQTEGRSVSDGVQGTPLLKARAMADLRKKPGRTEYQRGIVSTGPDGRPQVAIAANQGSGVLSSMVQGNGLVVLHHAQGNVAAGDEVDVLMLDGLI